MGSANNSDKSHSSIQKQGGECNARILFQWVDKTQYTYALWNFGIKPCFNAKTRQIFREGKPSETSGVFRFQIFQGDDILGG
jgi:hypothetical protein